VRPDGSSLRTDAKEHSCLSQDQNLFLSGLSEKSIFARFAYFLRTGIASVVVSMTNGETAEVGMIGHEGVVGAISSAGKLSGPDQLLYSIGGNSSKDSHAGLSSCLSIIGGRYGNAFWSVRSSNLTVSVKSQAATVYMKQRQGWRAGS
jgi:hypothetical protein